jgi:hypothetical protein
LILRGVQGPEFQYIVLFETRTARKPVLCGVKKSLLDGSRGISGVGKSVGISVAVPVGVYKSAPSDVTVGVAVSGVGVEVANRFCVGMGVSLTKGVAVSVGRGGVGEASKDGRFGRPEQPTRMIPSKRR